MVADLHLNKHPQTKPRTPAYRVPAGWPLRPFSPARHVQGATGALSAQSPR